LKGCGKEGIGMEVERGLKDDDEEEDEEDEDDDVGPMFE